MAKGTFRSKKFSFIRTLFSFVIIFCIIYAIGYLLSFFSKSSLQSFIPDSLLSTEVAGKSIRDLQTTITGGTKKASTVSDASESKVLKLKIAILADSHADDENLKKALDKAKSMDVSTVFFLGDYTRVGAKSELEAAKKVMDASSLPYYSIPGDHDIAQGSTANFTEVFGDRYQSLSVKGVTFILLDNSDDNGENAMGVDTIQMAWFKKELSNLQTDAPAILLTANPLYGKSGFRLMGDGSSALKAESDELLALIRKSEIKVVVAGDSHLSSRSQDPEKKGLEHIVVGALLTGDTNLQTPRFDVMEIYDDGSYSIEEVIL